MRYSHAAAEGASYGQLMREIIVKNAKTHNLKNVSLHLPLGKLVAIVGKSGSGKSSFVYDILAKAAQGQKVEAVVSRMPRTFVMEQKTIAAGTLSLGETTFKTLRELLHVAKKGDLLILDEPCAGMAKEDRQEIIRLLKQAVGKGISVVAVEHNKDVITQADYVIEFGPEAGAGGGRVVFEGSIGKFKTTGTLTSSYAFSRKAELVDYVRKPNERAQRIRNKEITISGITKNHLKNFHATIRLGGLVCVTGRVGTGKTTLLSVVYGALFKGKDAWKYRQGYKKVIGKEYVRRSYFVDQTSLSAISTSTPATYLGIGEAIKKSYGKKHLKSMDRMTVDEAAKAFADVPLVTRKLGFLQEVGLGYIVLGQKSHTLSGGEAQRVRLAKILSKKLGDRCIYILDVPTRGLHLSDLPTLMKVFQVITDKNNTILIADNREEIIKNCDEVISLKK